MADERVFIGQFMKNRAPDTAADELAPGGIIDPAKSVLEQIHPAIVLSKPAELPPEPAPPLSRPSVLPEEPAPALSIPSIIPFEPAPPLVLSHPPADPIKIDEPPRTVAAAEEPHPTSPKVHAPADPLKLADFPKTTVAARQPSQFPQAPAVLPGIEPVPTTKGAIAAPRPLPGSQPLPTDQGLIAQPRPLPGNQPVPPVGQPLAPLDPKRDINDQTSPGGTQGTPIAVASPRAPGGQLDPANDLQLKVHQANETIQAVLNAIGDKFTDVFGGAPGFSGGPAGLTLSPVGTPGDLALDPLLFAKNTARLGAHLGAAGLAAFSVQQAGLFAQNARGRVWNPAMISPLPVAQNFMPSTLDPPNLTFSTVPGSLDPAKDIHAAIAKGTFSADRVTPGFYDLQLGIGSTLEGGTTKLVGADSQHGSLVEGDPARLGPGSIIEAALKQRNVYGPGSSTGQSEGDDTYPTITKASNDILYGIDNLIDEVITGNPDNLKLAFGNPIFSGDTAVGTDLRRLTTAFLDKRPVNVIGASGEQRFRRGDKARTLPDALVKSAFTQGIIPVKFSGENDFGFVTTRGGESPMDTIDDDDAYVPVSFTDLRPVQNVYRTVYFRPMITSFSENFSPEWNEQNYYGRTDSVATYQSTGRSIQLSFQIVAFGPEDIKTIYQKLHWLASMVYPEYDSDLVFRSGPVIRLRIGDVISALGPEGARGLPGILKSLDFDYGDSLWELSADFKVPRNINVSLAFHVLHDKPIGRGADARFGGIGTFDGHGKYVPPGRGQSGQAGSDSDKKLAEVSKGAEAFRLVGGKKADDLVNYAGKKIEDL